MALAARSDGWGTDHDGFRLGTTMALGDQLADALTRPSRACGRRRSGDRTAPTSSAYPAGQSV